MEVIEAGEQKLVFERSSNRQRLRCTFNLSDAPTAWETSGSRIISSGEVSEHTLGAWSAVVEAIP